MKTFTTLILVSIAVSITASPKPAYAEPVVGVKKGDWIEYSISIAAGPPLDSLRNLTWYRTEILEVNGASFKANKTALSVNGTVSSSIWYFDLAEGEVQGWAIIPANLSPGNTFFDYAKSANVTIEGEEPKNTVRRNANGNACNRAGKGL